MDTLNIAFAQDVYLDDALAEVWFDGVMLGTVPIKADRAKGAAQAAAFVGEWGNGEHHLNIYFKNDEWGGEGKDRNLFVLGVVYNDRYITSPVGSMWSNNISYQLVIPALLTSVPGGLVKRPPLSVLGNFKMVLDATFGKSRADATVRTQEDLFGANGLAYATYIYGASDKLPTQLLANGARQIGPTGDGCDGLYGNYRSRHHRYAEGTAWDVHVIGDSNITLKAWCGLYSGKPDDCGDAQIESGLIRFVQPLRPGCYVAMRAKLPAGMYSWPTFWLNPGEQPAPDANGMPVARKSAAWPPEIDVIDQVGFNNVKPGRYLVAATPDGGNPAAYAVPGQAGPVDLPMPQGGTLIETSVASFSDWYATTKMDLTADFHEFGLDWKTDGTLDFYLDDVLYRRRAYFWPASSPPAHLMAGLQIGNKSNDLSGIIPQGGLTNGWDYQIEWVRAFERY